VAGLSTFENRNIELADLAIVCKPQTDLAILNFIAHPIIATGRIDRGFVDKHVAFRKGAGDIGYGLRPEHPVPKAAANADNAAAAEPIDLEAYATVVAQYTADKVAALSGVPAEKLVELAELYTEPKRKVVSC